MYLLHAEKEKLPHLEVGIPGHEEEVIVHELLPDGLLHAGEGVVGAGQVPRQVGERFFHEVLHTQALVLGDSGGQAEPVNVATHPVIKGTVFRERFRKC